MPFLFHLINNDFQAAARSGGRIVPNAASLGIRWKPGPLMAFRCRLPQPTRWAVCSIKAKKKNKKQKKMYLERKGLVVKAQTPHVTLQSLFPRGVGWGSGGVEGLCCKQASSARRRARGRTPAWHKSKFITVGGGNWSSGDGRNRLCWRASSTRSLPVGRDVFSCLFFFFFSLKLGLILLLRRQRRFITD